MYMETIMRSKTMSKTLWFIIGAAVGYLYANHIHPYDTCKEMYADPIDIAECVWIKENP